MILIYSYVNLCCIRLFKTEIHVVFMNVHIFLIYMYNTCTYFTNLTQTYMYMHIIIHVYNVHVYMYIQKLDLFMHG